MKCKTCSDRMMDMIAGELGERGKRRMQRHLDGCRVCREEYEALQETLALTRSVREEISPPAGIDRVIIAQAGQQAGRKPPRSFFLLRPMPAAVAVFALVLVMSTVFLKRTGTPMDMLVHQQPRPAITAELGRGKTGVNGRAEGRVGAKSKRSGESTGISSREAETQALPPEEETRPSVITIHRLKPSAHSTDSAATGAFGREHSPRKKTVRKELTLPPVEPDTSLNPLPPHLADKNDGFAEAMMDDGVDAELMEKKAGMVPAAGDIRFTMPPGAVPPVIVHREEPRYPPSLKDLAVTGRVVVIMDIAPDGQGGNFRVIAGDHALFSAAVLDALKAWRFEPARLNGKPVKATMTFTAVFGKSPA